jgi:hypothetical protein
MIYAIIPFTMKKKFKMKGKKMTNKDLIFEFVKGNYKKDYRQVNNLSYRVYKDNGEYSILYSYSTAIAIRKDNFFIVNNNRYSQTTAVHCGGLKSDLHIMQKDYIEMNFPLLYQAQVYPENIKILDILKIYNDYGFLNEYFILFTANQGLAGDFYFLYGIDNGLKTRFKDFLCKLPDKTETVKQALDMLNPIPIEQRNGVLRQGEYFFKPIGNTRELKKLINEKYKDKLFFEKKLTNIGKYSLSTMFFEDEKNFVRQNHIPSYFIVLKDGLIFARGDVKHKFKEHKVLHLGKTWYQVFRNTAIQSWTVNNNSD